MEKTIFQLSLIMAIASIIISIIGAIATYFFSKDLFKVPFENNFTGRYLSLIGTIVSFLLTVIHLHFLRYAMTQLLLLI